MERNEEQPPFTPREIDTITISLKDHRVIFFGNSEYIGHLSFGSLSMLAQAAAAAFIGKGVVEPLAHEYRDQTFEPLTETGQESRVEPEPVTPEPTPPSPAVPQAEHTPASEKQPIHTVSGELKTKPHEGRPDSKGKPTAWALLAAHEEGEEGAHMYSTTFNRGARTIALRLPQGAPVTVRGYRHPTSSPDHNDRLNVFQFVDYPGKPATEGTHPRSPSGEPA